MTRRKPTGLDNVGASILTLGNTEEECCKCGYYISNENVYLFNAPVISPDKRRYLCTACAPNNSKAAEIIIEEFK